ncbi:hypothetical protein ACHAWU_002797 [Discostella pseudostelligera]|uniref:RNase III domain-containing protein n=1 Tax=Discostella pseudostelligera TaxID=259834 RepID=A0ABD3M2N3_9STRA
MMQSSFVAFCHFSWLCSKQHEMYSYPRPEMMSRRHLIGRSLAPLPSSCRDLSTVITHAAVGSSGEGTSTEMGNNTQHNSSEQNDDPSMFLELMSPIASAKPDQMSASSLAYLGDVLFELFVRSRYVWPSRRMSDLQDKVVSVVRAEAQSIMLQKFVEMFPLTPTEQSVLARGRNANLTASKKSKGANASAYQDSSAFEALLGYTYICDKPRFSEMISWMKKELDELDAV